MAKARVVLLLCLFASCAHRRTIVVDGQSIDYEDAAAQAFARAKAALDKGRNDEAAAQFAGVVEQYGDSSYAEEARLRRGQALARAERLLEAQAVLQDLLVNRPTTRFKKEAALELSEVQGRLGKKEEAAAAMKAAVGEMSESEKKQAAQAIAEAYARTGESGEALRFAAKAIEGAQAGPERDARLAEFEKALDGASGSDVARLVADLDHGSLIWPLAALKLARIDLHVGDRAHADELSRQVLAQVNAGPIAEGAQAVQLAVSSAAGVKPNLIGIVLPLGGEYKAFAEDALNAVALTLDLQNRAGVQVAIKDSRGEPDAAARAVEELAKEGAIAILGPIALAEGIAAAVRAQQLGVPILSLSRAEQLTQIGDYVFRDMVTYSEQAKAIAGYAQKKLGAKNFAILQPDSNYGEEMGRYFWDALDEAGAEVRAFEHYPQRTTTFKPFVAKMVGRFDLSERKEFGEEAEKIAQQITDPYKRRKALAQLRSQTAPLVDFDALFIPDGARTVRLIAPAIAAEDVITAGCDERELSLVRKTTRRDDLRTVQLLGTNFWDNPELVDERMGVAKYVQCSIFVDSFFAQSQRPATRKFVDEYDSAYHKVPGFLEAHAHDAAAILRRLVEERRPQTRADMQRALASMQRPFPGAAGDTVFGREREAKKPLFWLWINRGTIQEFDPEGPPPVPPAAPQPPLH